MTASKKQTKNSYYSNFYTKFCQQVNIIINMAFLIKFQDVQTAGLVQIRFNIYSKPVQPHNIERTALLLELQNIIPNITLNSNLFQTGNNDKNLDLRTKI